MKTKVSIFGKREIVYSSVHRTREDPEFECSVPQHRCLVKNASTGDNSQEDIFKLVGAICHLPRTVIRGKLNFYSAE